MAYVALYRKWRPLTFSEVVRQDHVVSTLKNSVKSGKIAHAYLFCGTRGTGKTTIAKIFARAINCTDPRNGDPCNECESCRGIMSGAVNDVYEIDAASNNGVDNVRDIIVDSSYVPSSVKYKVYIIDEVHMLSAQAFNALLKTLEEPASHVVFILATTEPNKLPPTILSRCQRYNFGRIDIDSISKRLKTICDEAGIKAEEDALSLIARLGDGALRDAISILDRCISSDISILTYENVIGAVGIVEDSFLTDFCSFLLTGDVYSLLSNVKDIFMSGKNLSLFVSDIISHYRDLMVCKTAKSPESIIDSSRKHIEDLKKESQKYELNYIFCNIKELSLLQQRMNYSDNPRILLETAIIKMCGGKYSDSNDELSSRLSVVEEKINSGNIQAKAVPDIQVFENQSGITKVAVLEAAVLEAAVPEKAVPEKVFEKIYPEKVYSEKAAEPHNLNESLCEFQSWQNVIDLLNKNGKKILCTVLTSAKAYVLDNNFIGIAFPENKSFDKTYLSKYENISIIEDVLKKVTGQEMKCKCIDEKSSNKAAGTENLKKAEDLSKLPETVLNVKKLTDEMDIPFDIIDGEEK